MPIAERVGRKYPAGRELQCGCRLLPAKCGRGRQLWKAPLVPTGLAHDAVTAAGARYRIGIAPRPATASRTASQNAR